MPKIRKPGEHYKDLPKPDEYYEDMVQSPADYFGEHSQDLKIGKTAAGDKMYLPLKALSTHVHIIGATRTGKSYFMEALLRDIITRGYGACLIDPHEQLYQNMVNFLATFPELAEKVILFDPSPKGDKYVGFNPLRRTNIFPEISTQVRYITSGVAKVWEEDSKNTPLLRRNMGNMLYPLIEGGYTLREAEAFIDLYDTSKRSVLVQSTSRQRVLNDWYAFDKMSQTKKMDLLGSLQNRMPDFLDSKAILYTLGRIKNVLDIEDIIENRKILLCNFSSCKNWLSDDDAYLLGVLLVNEMTNYAKSCRTREVGLENPYFLFIDELENFITPDIGRILDECRKFGLHLIMAHQHLAQLKEQDRILFNSVMTNARTKVVFGGVSWEDLEILEKEVFAGTHNLKEVKDEIVQRMVVDYDLKEFLVEGGSTSDGLSTTDGSGDNSSYGTTLANMATQTVDPSRGIIINPVLYEMRGSTSAQVAVGGKSRFKADKNIVKLKNQPTQYAYIKVMEEPPVPIKITTVVDFETNEEKVNKLYEQSYHNQGKYYLSAPEIEAEFEETDNKIAGLLEAENKEPDDFRE